MDSFPLLALPLEAQTMSCQARISFTPPVVDRSLLERHISQERGSQAGVVYFD